MRRSSRGFKLLGRRLAKAFRWGLHSYSRNKPAIANYQTLNPQAIKAPRTIWNWCRSLKRGCLAGSKPSYIRVGRGEIKAGRPEVPKGHLAVYVGEREDDPRRCLVPVIYFNHPLFENLLREAEAEYGFYHPGGIQIPCGLSEFKNVQTRIAAAAGTRRRSWRLRR